MNYIHSVSYEHYHGGTNNLAVCQLYNGPLCVAKGTSLNGKEQAIKNAYRNLKRGNNGKA